MPRWCAVVGTASILMTLVEVEPGFAQAPGFAQTDRAERRILCVQDKADPRRPMPFLCRGMRLLGPGLLAFGDRLLDPRSGSEVGRMDPNLWGTRLLDGAGDRVWFDPRQPAPVLVRTDGGWEPGPKRPRSSEPACQAGRFLTAGFVGAEVCTDGLRTWILRGDRFEGPQTVASPNRMPGGAAWTTMSRELVLIGWRGRSRRGQPAVMEAEVFTATTTEGGPPFAHAAHLRIELGRGSTQVFADGRRVVVHDATATRVYRPDDGWSEPDAIPLPYGYGIATDHRNPGFSMVDVADGVLARLIVRSKDRRRWTRAELIDLRAQPPRSLGLLDFPAEPWPVPASELLREPGAVAELTVHWKETTPGSLPSNVIERSPGVSISADHVMLTAPSWVSEEGLDWRFGPPALVVGMLYERSVLLGSEGMLKPPDLEAPAAAGPTPWPAVRKTLAEPSSLGGRVRWSRPVKGPGETFRAPIRPADAGPITLCAYSSMPRGDDMSHGCGELRGARWRMPRAPRRVPRGKGGYGISAAARWAPDGPVWARVQAMDGRRLLARCKRFPARWGRLASLKSSCTLIPAAAVSGLAAVGDTLVGQERGGGVRLIRPTGVQSVDVDAPSFDLLVHPTTGRVGVLTRGRAETFYQRLDVSEGALVGPRLVIRETRLPQPAMAPDGRPVFVRVRDREVRITTFDRSSQRVEVTATLPEACPPHLGAVRLPWKGLGATSRQAIGAFVGIRDRAVCVLEAGKEAVEVHQLPRSWAGTGGRVTLELDGHGRVFLLSTRDGEAHVAVVGGGGPVVFPPSRPFGQGGRLLGLTVSRGGARVVALGMTKAARGRKGRGLAAVGRMTAPPR